MQDHDCTYNGPTSRHCENASHESIMHCMHLSVMLLCRLQPIDCVCIIPSVICSFFFFFFYSLSPSLMFFVSAFFPSSFTNTTVIFFYPLASLLMAIIGGSYRFLYNFFSAISFPLMKIYYTIVPSWFASIGGIRCELKLRCALGLLNRFYLPFSSCIVAHHDDCNETSTWNYIQMNIQLEHWSFTSTYHQWWMRYHVDTFLDAIRWIKNASYQSVKDELKIIEFLGIKTINYSNRTLL